MTDAVEVLIEKALLTRATAFAAAQGLPIAMPNKAFIPPPPKVEVSGNPTVFNVYLRATIMPAPTNRMEIPSGGRRRHYGLMQIDVFMGEGAGNAPITRIAGACIGYFPDDLRLTQDTVDVTINDPLGNVSRKGSLMTSNGWAQIPVSIPYQCFARPS